MQLSANFQLKEFTRSQTASRLGIDNTPQGEHMENLKYVVEKICQPVREAFGKPVRINSGYRSPALNKAVGGSKTSQHCNGQAVDMEIDGVPNKVLADWITENCDFDQVILEFYNPAEGANSGWVHASVRSDGQNRGKKLIAFKDGKKTRYEFVEDFDKGNEYEDYI
jgi:zinc D-Ala-D-Ala carboxypeptidase